MSGTERRGSSLLTKEVWKAIGYALGLTAIAALGVVAAARLIVAVDGQPLRWIDNRIEQEGSGCLRHGDAQLGSWTRVTCSSGQVIVGPLRGVAGGAAEIEAAIAKFEAVIGDGSARYSCTSQANGSLSCEISEISLNDHLAQHGFAATSTRSVADRRAVESWLATLLGFTGAAVSFFITYRKEETTELLKRQNLKNRVTADLEAFKAAVSAVADLENPKPVSDFVELCERLDETNKALMEAGIDTLTLDEILRSFKAGGAQEDHSVQINRLLMKYRDELDA
ncbi:hypothetical protein [Alloyangia pacifica]|uniref:hypothetical protein n=1 Tax=Alloyangia pacifica TaxID=311180 RepID=UPI001CFCA6F6|nr:hypothetical protein [Alloyangia pacifica]